MERFEGNLNLAHGVLRVPATETPEQWSKRLLIDA
jgi:hypothetical protein